MSSQRPGRLADAAVVDLLTRAGVDPGDGLQVLDAARLSARPFDPGVALLVLPSGEPTNAKATDAELTDTSVAQPADTADQPTDPAARPTKQGVDDDTTALPGRHAHGTDPAVLLKRLYPADHPVYGPAGASTVADLESTVLARAPHLLPALDPLANVASPFGLPWLVDRLRRPDGCPWDREQDHLTLRPYLLEETYEVYDALEGGDTPELAEELGDLLLQIVLHAQYAAEAGAFDLADVQRGITTKIIRRHPHVFGDFEARTAADVIRNWEQLKAGERAAAAADRAAAGGSFAAQPGDAHESTVPDGSRAPVGQGDEDARPAERPHRRDPEMPAAFAGLSRSLPALAYADEMQARAAGLGYDWPDLEGVIDKIAEEASELLAATDDRQRHEEFGDLLFVIVNMGRKLGIDAEAALRSASRKFAARFARVERLAEDQGLQLKALGLDALDELWQEAKRDERRDA